MNTTLVQDQSDDVYELGSWIGRRQAFAAIAGSCSAADAECLRRVRDRKQYRALGLSWDEFCQQRIGINRKTAEQVIRRLEEFGPQYFALAQIAGVTPAQYRRIAASVTSQGLLHAGETIPIQAENASRLSAAIKANEESMHASEPAASQEPDPEARAVATNPARFDPVAGDRAIDKAGTLLRSAVTALERAHMLPLDDKQRNRLSNIFVDELRKLTMAQLTVFRLP